ncbi:SMC-Scp complex subunit ScpB [Daejeonella lutea]|uniref:Segregation and condensation protein B n=1 Tax=Daejeonella lutea TaxID=572036 RepID=A0A1T5B8M2_9SPHI|nr:SMC-Scp complex subunit ScpB [Daejeonella lutea]SKB43243.1 segregation and condensation protein B [Daejeonella lutea]
MSSYKLENFIEALIFASERGISVDEIQQVMEEAQIKKLNAPIIIEMVETIRKKYVSLDLALELVFINGGYQFLTRKEYYPVVNQLQIQRSKKRLSQAALETLAIVAYKQPITKLEIEQIRGVNCDYTVHKLLEKELISIMGKADTVGKPILYGTSSVFMDYFGINSTEDLPQLTDLQTENNSIGEQAD